jgi:uncharacterized membrane protein YeaQ/YmgE (transglycosylase-associated protein family)
MAAQSLHIERRTPEDVLNKLTLLLVGLAAGWLAEHLTGRDQTLAMNLLVGIAGAFMGGVLATRVLDLHYSEGFNPTTIAVATAGSVLLLIIVEAFNQTSGSF